MNWVNEDVSFSELRDKAEHPADRKECGPYLLGRIRGGRRLRSAIIDRTGALLDFDAATEETWERATDLDVLGIVHTTYSSRPDALRLRVIVPFDRPATPEEYPRVVHALAERIGVEALDPGSYQPERFMYRPSVADEHRDAYRYAILDGPEASVDELLAECAEVPVTKTAPAEPSARGDRPATPEEASYVARIVPLALADLDELAALPEGGRNDRGQGWEEAGGLFNVVARLVGLSNLDPVGYPIERAEQDVLARAPKGEHRRFQGKWADALDRVGDRPAVVPDAAEDFSDLGPAEAEQAASEARPDAFERGVARELDRLRVREAARRRFTAENLPEPVEYDAGTLADHLLKPPPPAARISGLIPWSASTAIIAMRKTGKTTLELNLARSLLTGEPFLDRFDVRPVDGTVAFLNFEVSGATLTAWAAEAGIPADRFLLVNLRGSGNPFSTPEDLARLGALLRKHEVESIIVDPFGRAFTGDSQNDAGQVQRWLLDLDRFAREDVGALDVVLSIHAGWDGERTRGSSAIEDWADSLVYLTRDQEAKDDPARFLRADGRDIDVPEDQLHFDHETRRLSLTGRGNRRSNRAARKIDSLIPAVVEVIEAEPGILTGEIEDRLRSAGASFQKGDGSKTARAAAERNLVRSERNKGTAVRWFPVPGGVVFPPDEEEDLLGEGPRRGSPK